MSVPSNKKIKSDESDDSARMDITSTPLIPASITPRSAIAVDFLRIVHNDWEWRTAHLPNELRSLDGSENPLVKLIQLNKHWFHIGTFLLWKTVKIFNQKAADSVILGISSPDRGLLYKRAITTLIFDLELSKQSICTIFSSLENGAQKLTALKPNGISIDQGLILDAVGPVVSSQLEWIDCKLTEKITPFSLVKRFDHLQRLPSLSNGFAKEELELLAPLLTHLTMTKWFPSSIAALNIILKSAVNLVDLEICDRPINETDDVLMELAALLDHSPTFLPKLRCLAVGEIFTWLPNFHGPLLHKFRHTFTRLELFELAFTEAKQIIAALLDSGKNETIKELRLVDIFGDGGDSDTIWQTASQRFCSLDYVEFIDCSFFGKRLVGTYHTVPFDVAPSCF